jgi:pimeloyl-ACP methyl ester carboxylesterase
VRRARPRSLTPLLGCALLLLAAEAAPAATPSPDDPRLRLSPCADEGLPAGSRCGTFTVFEDREAGTGRTLELALVVIPGTGPERARRAVAFLPGGPGMGATGAAAGIAHWLAEVRGERDLLLVDQRGTGGSNPLRCPYQEEERRLAEYLEDPFAIGRLQECRDALEARADLTLYTTPFVADDLDEVREALGYESLDLVGVSYGTRAALVYARQHPARARTLTLLGPVSTDARLPYRMAADLDASLRGSFADCAADAACGAAFPDLAGDLRRLLERVAAGVGPVSVRAPSGRGTVEVPISRQLVVQALRYMLYHPATQARLPYAVHQGGSGDFGPIASFAAAIGSSFNQSADGLYNAIVCAEDLPRFTLEEGRAAAAGTVLGELRVNHQKAACALWPTGRLPAGYHDPVRVATPTVLVVGERDPATPPGWAREIAAHLPESLLVVVPQAGHEATEGLLGAECLEQLPARFIAAGTVAGLDVSCAATARLPPWALEGEPPAVELPREMLAAAVGRYASPEGLSVTIELVAEGLQVSAFGHTLPLEALSTERFRILGAPPGFALELLRGEGGEVTGVILEQGPGSRTRLQRADGEAS